MSLFCMIDSPSIWAPKAEWDAFLAHLDMRELSEEDRQFVRQVQQMAERNRDDLRKAGVDI